MVDANNSFEINADEEAEFIQNHLLMSNTGFMEIEDIKAVLEAAQAFYVSKGFVEKEGQNGERS